MNSYKKISLAAFITILMPNLSHAAAAAAASASIRSSRPPMPTAAAPKKPTSDRNSIAEQTAGNLARKFSKNKQFDRLRKLCAGNVKLPDSLAYYLAYGGHLTQLKELSFDKEPNFFACPARIAAINGYFDIVDWMVANNLTASASSGLHYACVANDLKQIRRYIEDLNIDPNNKNEEGFTPLEIVLYYSASSTNPNLPAIFKYLTTQAKVKAKIDYYSFATALTNGERDIVTVFINSLDNITVRIDFIEGLIRYIKLNYSRIILALAHTVNHYKVTPKTYIDNVVGVFNNKLKHLTAEREISGPLHAPTPYPLEYADTTMAPAEAKALVENNSDDGKEKKKTATAPKKIPIVYDRKYIVGLSQEGALDLAGKFLKKDRIESLKQLFAWNTNLMDSLQNFLACNKCFTQLMELTFEKAPRIIDCPASIAAAFNRFDVVDWMIKNNRTSSSRLHYACLHCNIEEIRECIEVLNIDTNNKNDEGLTPFEALLNYASHENPNLPAVFEYLTKQAKVKAKTDPIFFVNALIKGRKGTVIVYINFLNGIDLKINFVKKLISDINSNRISLAESSAVLEFSAIDKVSPTFYVTRLMADLGRILNNLFTIKVNAPADVTTPTPLADAHAQGTPTESKALAEHNDGDSKEEKRSAEQAAQAPKRPRARKTADIELARAIAHGSYEDLINIYTRAKKDPAFLQGEYGDRLVTRIINKAPAEKVTGLLQDLIDKNKIKITLDRLIDLAPKIDDKNLSLLIQSLPSRHSILSQAEKIFEETPTKYIDKLPTIEKIIMNLRSLLVD